jgi:hypothetical protein
VVRADAMSSAQDVGMSSRIIVIMAVQLRSIIVVMKDPLPNAQNPEAEFDNETCLNPFVNVPLTPPSIDIRGEWSPFTSSRRIVVAFVASSSKPADAATKPRYGGLGLSTRLRYSG